MTNVTPLLRCALCAGGILSLENVERSRGEWIIHCPVCMVENVLYVHLGSRTKPIEIVGWRE